MLDKSVAILTGDIVNSSKVIPSVLDKAIAQLDQSAKAMPGWMSGEDLRFTRFRGDGWQVFLAWPWLALRAALVFGAVLRAGETGLSTRISIGIGPIDGLGTASLADAHGFALEESGRGLDGMKSFDRIKLAGKGISARDQIIINLLTERAGRWTVPQAEAAAIYLHPDNPSLEKIATKLNISAQAVGYRLRDSGATQIRRELGTWEDTVENEYFRHQND